MMPIIHGKQLTILCELPIIVRFGEEGACPTLYQGNITGIMRLCYNPLNLPA